MPRTKDKRLKRFREALRESKSQCELLGQREVRHVSDFVWLVESTYTGQAGLWFRGHSDARYRLTPAALRYERLLDRNNALDLVPKFKRAIETKLPNLPAGSEAEKQLKWLQLAQHYGLPTRLLDWTKNAVVALYFTCNRPDRDGAVYILDPANLNTKSYKGKYRVFTPEEDIIRINRYLRLRGRCQSRKGLHTIAIEPTWNSDRIVLQQGCFTLHGSRHFELTALQAPGLLCIPVLAERKTRLLVELGRIGVGEMFIFPEIEHVCSHLKRAADLHEAETGGPTNP